MLKLSRIVKHKSIVLFIVLCSGCLLATPSRIEYSQELQALTKALDAIHPNPWRKQPRQAFRDHLTQDPNILDSYPLGTWLAINQSLMSLDPQQQDAVTGVNLLHQSRQWTLLPVIFARFDEGFYIIAAEESYQHLIGQQIVAINGQSTGRLFQQLARYFPPRDSDWINQYLRITELLTFLGAGCEGECELSLSGASGDHTVRFNPDTLIRSTEYQKTITPTYIYPSFLNNQTAPIWVEMLNSTSLYWRLSQMMLKSTPMFQQHVDTVNDLLNNEMLENMVLDLRHIHVIDPTLVEQFSRLIRETPETNVQLRLYVIVDRSSRPVIFDLLGRLSDIPEVIFVGESPGLELSHFYDPKPLLLPKTAVEIQIATRFNKFLTRYPDQQRLSLQTVVWSASDYFSQQDSVISTIRDLIEIRSY